MKKISILCSSLFLLFASMAHGFSSQPDCGLLVGQPAPEFSASAVVQGQIVDNFSLQDLTGKYVILLFYPMDFTFVCPTEHYAFQAKANEFAVRNAQVVACSVDSVYSHLAWLNTPKEMGGIQGVEYPIISDFNKSISNSYQVLSAGEGVAYRGLFIIDPQGFIRFQLVNDLPIGRSVNEVLRTLDALITHDKIGEVCPADWTLGDKTLKPTTQGLLDYLK